MSTDTVDLWAHVHHIPAHRPDHTAVIVPPRPEVYRGKHRLTWRGRLARRTPQFVLVSLATLLGAIR
jgi:hypothetical protein